MELGVNKKFYEYGLCAMVTLILTACGGGGSSITPPITSMSGTVAIGAPIAGAVITARDANGRTSSSVIADADGKYNNLDVSNLTAPLVIEAVGQLGQTPYRLSTPIVSTSATANVTTLTTTLSALIAGGDPSSLNISNVTATSLATASQALSTAIAPVMQTIGISSSNFNPITDAFNADSTGKDKLLDALDIRHRTTGVYVSNRLEPITEGQTDANLTQVAIVNGQVSGQLPAGTDRDVAALRDIATKLNACFAIPAAQRVSSSPDAFGTQIPSSTHATCQTFLETDYQHNTYSFSQRWVTLLRDPAFDNSKFTIQLRYVVSNAFPSINKDAYVTNLNFQDSEGNGYTRPEVAILTNGSYKLYGNHRTLDAGAEPVITKITDYTNTSSSTGNRVEGRLRFWMTPNRAFDSVTQSYKFFYNGSNKPDPVLPCAWITGPGLPGDGAMNSANTGPLGGVLMKVPRSDYVARQDYLAVHVKFPETFDPFGSDADRRSLMKACAAREWNGTSWEIGTWNTNSQLTIDAAKDSATSGFNWPSFDSGNKSYSWDASSTSYSAVTVGGTSYPAMVGNKYGTYALSAVDATTKANYKPTTMPTYTFYAFSRDSVTGNTKVTYAAVSGSAAAVPVVTSAQADAFWTAKTMAKGRMIGAMPYLITDANGVYSGKDAFSTVTTASTFLNATATTIASGGALAATWTVPKGASGVDRVGYSCWANWTNGSSEVRWGPSVSSNSWGVPRNITTKSFSVEEECAGYDWGTSNTPTITSRYREVWARSYDSENRQIQSVQYAKR